MSRRALVWAALSLTFGCDCEAGPSGPECPAGYVYSEEELGCVSADMSVDDLGSDPCGGCGTDQVCDADSGSCVACLVDGDCGDDVCLVDDADSANNECVGCVDSEDCSGALGVCDEESNECVGCLMDADCTEAAMAKCDTGTNTCVECDSSTQCAGTGENECVAGACVECTEGTAETHCGVNSCNPATGECTETERGSLDPCEACVADSECGTDHYCVPMNYMGTDRGGYCLKDTTGGCEQPLAISLTDRTTLSMRTGGSYCGISEAVTTCEAVKALVDNQTCPGGLDSECPESGLCRQVGTLANRCTYECMAASSCLEPPLNGNTCGDGGDSGSVEFCGG